MKPLRGKVFNGGCYTHVAIRLTFTVPVDVPYLVVVDTRKELKVNSNLRISKPGEHGTRFQWHVEGPCSSFSIYRYRTTTQYEAREELKLTSNKPCPNMSCPIRQPVSRHGSSSLLLSLYDSPVLHLNQPLHTRSEEFIVRQYFRNLF